MLSEFKIGHYTNIKDITGCTVIIPPPGNTASASVRGASPGTREFALLSPERKISEIHALLLTGGSAFGLNAAHGIMEALSSDNKGYSTDYGIVPIVPAAVIFDKNIGNPAAYPGIANAQTAYEAAEFNNHKAGNIGAGTGATIGKWAGIGYAVKGGLGVAAEMHQGIKVTVVTVVNAVGDIMDYNGSIYLGAAAEHGTFLAQSDPRRRWQSPKVGLAENTVLSAVLTNAKLTKQQAHHIAERAHCGISRRIEPSHTSFDGDTIFTIASNQVEAPLELVAAMAISAVEKSILNGVSSAESIGGFRSYKTLMEK